MTAASAGIDPHWLSARPHAADRQRLFRSTHGEAQWRALRKLIASPGEPVSAPVLIVPANASSLISCRALIDAYRPRTAARNPGLCATSMASPSNSSIIDHKRRSDLLVQERRTTAIDPRHGYKRSLIRRRSSALSQVRGDKRVDTACSSPATTAPTAAGTFARIATIPRQRHRASPFRLHASTSNADEYEGGDLCFAEFGQRTYRRADRRRERCFRARCSTKRGR